MEFLISTFAFIISYLASLKGYFVISGIILIISGLLLYFINYRKSGSIIDPAALFSVSWVSSAGVSCLKLSNLQTNWSIKTWLVIFISYILFLVSYYYFRNREIKLKGISIVPDNRALYNSVIILTLSSYLFFLIEVLILGFIPLFTVDTPHAYSYFHVSGLHYFTVLCVLVPSFSVVYLNNKNDRSFDRNTITVITCTVFSLFLPILLVSRYQLLFSFILALITFIILKSGKLKKYTKPKYLIPFFISILSLILLYILITVERAHSIEYLNGIFEMKNPETPIFITQPYIYIANNFDNLNCLVTECSEHTYGLRALYPLFALTGLKFLKPELVSFPLYVTKEELTTVTIIYDAFYDFGIIGVAVFSIFLGFIMAVADKINKTGKNPVYIIISAQLTGYLCLSFFTTWYSNPTTWFYIIICIAMNMCMCYNTKNAKFRKVG